MNIVIVASELAIITGHNKYEKIQKAIASVGHDTELYSAKEEDYNNLHSCCKYERKK